MYIITNRKTNTYVYYDKATGKYTITPNIKYATSWDHESKAKNVMRSSLPKTMKGEYAVMQMPGTTNNETEDVVVMSSDFCDHHLDNQIEIVKQFSGLILNSVERRNELNEELSNIDKEISDIGHFIEFNDVPDNKKTAVFSVLQAKYRRRREIKNETEFTNKLADYKCGRISLSGLAERTVLAPEKMYTPRVLQDIFKTDTKKNTYIRKKQPVNQYDPYTGDLVATYDSIANASRHINGSLTCVGSISQCCRGIKSKAYGFGWKYAS